MEIVKEFLRKIWDELCEFFKKYIVVIFIMVGPIVIFIGVRYEDSIVGKTILSSGVGMLGGGVFAVILKSALFTEIFKKHMYEVFYDPISVKGGVSLIERWRVITSALLKEVLPPAHSNVVDSIQKQFFNSEIEYHFENHKIGYEIDVDKLTNIATIIQHTETTIILSPKATNPILKLSIKTFEDGYSIKKLQLNGIEYSGLAEPKPHSTDPKLWETQIPLNLATCAKERGNDRIVVLDRVISRKLDLKKDPYISAEIERCVKGAKIKAKISAGYKLHFQRFGLGNLPSDYYTGKDESGFEEWQIAAPECLLLPGQGFVIIPVLL